MEKIIGIYQIKNKVNKKIYIGSSVDIKQRWAKHLHELKKGIHSNKYLLESFKKYGEENFDFILLEKIQDSSLIIEREQYYLDYYKSYEKENGYNLRKKAETNLGYRHSQQSIEKFRQASIGKKHTEEWKQTLRQRNSGENNPFYGMSHSNTSREKISLKNKGKKRTEEFKQKLSEMNSGNNNPFFGRKHSEESRAKISEKKT